LVWSHPPIFYDEKRAWRHEAIHEVLRLLRFCLDATFVAYQGKWYQQTFGTAMGSPVSVTVANLVMEDVEERALASYPTLPPFLETVCVHCYPPDHLERFP